MFNFLYKSFRIRKVLGLVLLAACAALMSASAQKGGDGRSGAWTAEVQV
jgi:hypothetical protein